MISTMLRRVILPGIGGAWSNKIHDVIPRLSIVLGVLDILHGDGVADYLSKARGMRKKSEAPCHGACGRVSWANIEEENGFLASLTYIQGDEDQP